MKKLIIIIVGLIIIVLTSCAPSKPNIIQVEGKSRITYYYDRVHEVGIWVIKGDWGDDIVVLPKSQFVNHKEPIEP